MNVLQRQWTSGGERASKKDFGKDGTFGLMVLDLWGG
jgi:hypothetical protein